MPLSPAEARSLQEEAHRGSAAMSMRADAIVAPLAEGIAEVVETLKIVTKGVSGPSDTPTAEADAVSTPVAGGVDGALESTADGGGQRVEAVVATEDTRAAEEPEAAAAAEDLSDETKAAIVKQAEFYFSDENLPTDAFMKKKVKSGGAQGWVPLKIISSFPKMKKLSKDPKVIGSTIEALSKKLVVQGNRVRRKTPFAFPDRDGMADFVSRTVVAVNIPADSTVESLTAFFSACGVAETVRVIRNGGQQSRSKEIQPPVGAHRNFYATCQFSTLEEAIRAVNELTDRSSWRGGLRVMLANGVTVEKALARLRVSGGKKLRHEKEPRSPTRGGEGTSPRPNGHVPKRKGDRNARNGQPRSRSLTELELEAVDAGGAGAAPREAVNGVRSPRRRTHEDGGSSGGDGGSDTPHAVARKPRSVSNVDSAPIEGGGGAGGGGIWDGSSTPHNNTANGDGLPRKGVVQTVSPGGMSWIKKDGNGSRKAGNRIPFWMADVVTKDGEEHQPLQKGDHVEYRTWRDHDGKMVAVRVERVKERPRSVGVGGNGNGGIAGGGGPAGQWRTDRATQAHFRMALGPEEGKPGFAAGRGRRIRGSSIGGPDTKEFVPTQLGGLGGGTRQDSAPTGVDDENGDTTRRPRGSSIGGPESKVFVPALLAESSIEDEG